ncbi:hypothetical protein [Rhizobium johnstonii]|uniref:hypothetical protein n=1 Tax=Rhizobium johnstonii TaxID=3019933 RepID=UPI003F9D77B5
MVDISHAGIACAANQLLDFAIALLAIRIIPRMMLDTSRLVRGSVYVFILNLIQVGIWHTSRTIFDCAFLIGERPFASDDLVVGEVRIPEDKQARI